MWLIRKINDEGTIHYLISGKKCLTIGRLNSDINLSDSSISRTHCVIKIAAKNECPFPVQTSTGIWLIDKKSKYGTFILKNHEWNKIEPDKVQELCNGTVIRFGLMENIWRFEYKPVIACASKLSKDQIEELKFLLLSIDGRFVNKWVKQCTIVFVNDVTVTVKVLLALINGIPIVTMNYLRQLVDNVKRNLAWPDYKSFKPVIAESTLIPQLVSLNAEDHRKELFKGKTFIVPTEEQIENLKEIITAAGGQVELLDLDGDQEKLTKENVIVIQLPCNQLINPDKNTNNFKYISDKLKNENNLRVVPETEIFQAIAYSSVEKYCNPKSLAFEIRQSLQNQNSCGDVIEEATPSQNTTKKRAKENTVQNTEVPHEPNSTTKDITPARKRKHSPEQESNKKIMLDIDKIDDAELLGIDDDLHVFLNGSNDKEPDKRAKENSPTKCIQVPKSVIKNDDSSKVYSEEQKFLIKLDNANNFWNDSEKNESKFRKRKMSENFKGAGSDQPEKKKRNLEDLHSSIFFSHEKHLNSTVSSSIETNKKISSRCNPKTEKHPEFIDKTDGKWIRRKNADFRGNGGQKVCDEIEWINKNTKNFRKKETLTHEPVANYIEENVEEIGKKLIMEGWYRSRSSRMRTLTAL